MDFKEGQWPNLPHDLYEFLINREDGGQLFYPETVNGKVVGLDRPHKWRKVDGDPNVGKRHSLGQAIEWASYLKKIEPDRPTLIAHVGEGSILWIDFDGEPDDPRLRASYLEKLDHCISTTYTEQSRSRGKFHAAFALPDGHGLRLRTIKAEGMPIDFLIGNGYVNLTGVSNGLDIAAIPADLLAVLQKTLSEAMPEGWQAPTDIVNDRFIAGLPTQEAIAEVRRRICNTEGYKHLLDGPSVELDGSNLSEMRAKLIQWAATLSCGHPDQLAIVWEIVSTSKLAEATPLVSKKNPHRFTRSATVSYHLYHPNGEYQKFIRIAREEVHAKQTASFAQQERMLALHGARAARLLEKASLEFLEQPDFPVEIYRRYRDWITSAVSETDNALANAATISHLGAALTNKVAGPSGTFANTFMVVIARAGFGKEVLSGETLEKFAPGSIKIHGMPRSDAGLYRKLLEGPTIGAGYLLIDEFGEWLSRVSRSVTSSERGIADFLKVVYGKAQLGRKMTGQDLASENSDRLPIAHPALTFLGMGTEDEVFAGLAAHGVTDGLVGRMLFVRGDGEPVFNDPISYELPADLKAIAAPILASLNRGPKPLHKVEFDNADLKEAHFQWRRKVSLWRRDNAGTKAQLLRSLCENTLRIATGLAYWNQSAISQEIYNWARIYTHNSAALAFDQDDRGRLDHGIISLAIYIEDKIGRFFNEGKCTNPLSAAPARAKGYFTMGYLPDYDGIKRKAAKSSRQEDVVRTIKSALNLLREERKIEIWSDEKGKEFPDRWKLGDYYDR